MSLSVKPLFRKAKKKNDNSIQISKESEEVGAHHSTNGHRFLNLQKRNLKDFYFLGHIPDLIDVDLRNNLFENFFGLGGNNIVSKIDLRGCPVSSFKGAISLPNLKNIDLIGCPVSRKQLISSICILAFGTSLVFVNERVVSVNDRQIALSFGTIGSKLVRKGWLPDHIPRDPQEIENVSPQEPMLEIHPHTKPTIEKVELLSQKFDNIIHSQKQLINTHTNNLVSNILYNNASEGEKDEIIDMIMGDFSSL